MDFHDLIDDWRENASYALEIGDVGACRAWERAIEDLEAKLDGKGWA